MTPEEERKNFYSKDISDLSKFKVEEEIDLGDLNLDDLVNAFNNLLKRKELEKPLNTKITRKEYSVKQRSFEIKKILKEKKQVEFDELFDTFTKDYVVVNFL